MIKLITATLLLLLSACPAYVAAQDFTITSFDAKIRIFEDGRFSVTETIDVTFERSKHGIYREIPFRYENELGNTVRMPIDVLEVTDRDGNRLTARVRKSGNVVNIRIGDADRYVDGNQSYVIKYIVSNGILFFDDFDELYWNITGNYWDAPIEKASATVELYSDDVVGKHGSACYTGRYGSNKSDCDIFANTVTTNRRLEPNEGLSVAFAFDKGIVPEPTEFDRFLMTINIKENWVFVLPFVSFFFVLSRWRNKGRDPKVRESLMVMYTPPVADNKELTAAEVGTLIDETMNPRDISASMIGLAVKGYLKIEEIEHKVLIFTSKDYQLTALKDDFTGLTEFERWLMVGLFKEGGNSVLISELKNKFYTYLPKLKKAVYRQLMDYKFFGTLPQHTIGKYIGYGVLALILTGLTQLFISGIEMSIKLILISITTALPFFLFSKAMPAKTRKGALVLADCLGFQEFLQRAEKDKLERMNDKDLFSKYLPYAIALNVVDMWAKSFEGIEQNIPTWYVGAHGITNFHPVAFSSAINTATSNLSSAVFSAPRSSGSSGGGGGFSGGGGGGGGGGSW